MNVQLYWQQQKMHLDKSFFFINKKNHFLNKLYGLFTENPFIVNVAFVLVISFNTELW